MKSHNGFRHLFAPAFAFAIVAPIILILWIASGAPAARADIFSDMTPPVPSFVPAPLIDAPCPSGVTCIFENKNTSCPVGKICTSVSATDGCPPLYVCYRMRNAPVAATTTATSSTAVAPALSIASMSRYYGAPGDSIIMIGTLFSTSSIVVLSGGSTGYIVINPTVLGSSTLSFIVPVSTPAGAYSLSVYNLTGSPSNAVSFVVTSSASNASASAASGSSSGTDTNAASAAANPSTVADNSASTAGIDSYAAYLAQQASSVQNPYVTAQTPSQTAASSGAFSVGDRVQTTTDLRVRSAASTQGAILGTATAGSQGTIAGGGTYSGGYYWWLVNYDSGADGWSAGEYLVSAGSSSAKPVKSTDCYNFNNNLSYGMGSGPTAYLARDIANLQIAFIREGFSISDYERASATASSTFGASTLAAAVKFQDKYGITPDAGYVGPITRAKLNSLYGCY